jgi:ABC-2 type transport system ATP-binding protein
MSKIVISVKDLNKTFYSFKKSGGLKASLRDFFKRETLVTEAVKNINFEVKKGEFIGFLGPNGAGKTTTLKMLTGILTPTSGEATVIGHIPWKRKTAYKKNFALVMGQKNQLWWDLPPQDSYELFKHMYEIPQAKYKKTLDMLTELLKMQELIQVPTRKMSLGQRMKAELIGALLHEPEVLFLDEPTIGLDVIAQKTIRDFLKTYNRETKATILLTSHYMEDIRQLCKRVVIIDHGNIIYDGAYSTLVTKYATQKIVDLSFTKHVKKADLVHFGSIIEYDKTSVRIGIDRAKGTKAIAEMLNKLPVEDISVHEKNMDAIVSDIFTQQYV